jgi:hypothetical protein
MGNPQEEATQLKNKGNDAFKNQDFPAALEFYTKAIELWDKEPSFYTNRAQVRKRLLLHMAVCLHHSLGKHQAGIVWIRSARCR